MMVVGWVDPVCFQFEASPWQYCAFHSFYPIRKRFQPVVGITEKCHLQFDGTWKHVESITLFPW